MCCKLIASKIMFNRLNFPSLHWIHLQAPHPATARGTQRLQFVIDIPATGLHRQLDEGRPSCSAPQKESQHKATSGSFA